MHRSYKHLCSEALRLSYYRGQYRLTFRQKCCKAHPEVRDDHNPPPKRQYTDDRQDMHEHLGAQKIEKGVSEKRREITRRNGSGRK
jgi:hypothetical protein